MATRRVRVAAKPSIGAGVAGASGGTGLLAMLHAIPDTNGLKPVLLFATPSISLVISAIWLFLMQRLDNYLAERAINDQLKRAEKALDELENNPRSTDRIKKDARSHVENLQLAKIEYHSNRVRVIVDA